MERVGSVSDKTRSSLEGASSKFGSSALAREVRRLKPAQRGIIGVTNEAILLWDMIVSLARIFVDDQDKRDLNERLSSFVVELAGKEVLHSSDIEDAVAYVQRFTTEDLPLWAQQLKKDGPVRFLVRLLGAAAFHRCTMALREDGAVLTVALQRATRALYPYAVALDDLYGTLPPSSIEQLASLTGGSNSALQLAFKLDEFFGEKARDWDLPLKLLSASDIDPTSVGVEELPAMVDRLREFSTQKSRAVVSDINDLLGKKMKGARDAIEHSADPVGQAASSLIELLDRTLRSAFTDDEVISWVQRNYPDLPDMTYIPKDSKSGTPKPTKRAQALCFAHAGVDVEQPSPLHQLAAAAISSARTGLQALKHDDEGTDEDLAELLRLLAAVEGFMTLVVGVVWAGAPTETVYRFRQRLAPRRVNE
jgi:hypothetical protein